MHRNSHGFTASVGRGFLNLESARKSCCSGYRWRLTWIWPSSCERCHELQVRCSPWVIIMSFTDSCLLHLSLIFYCTTYCESYACFVFDESDINGHHDKSYTDAVLLQCRITVVWNQCTESSTWFTRQAMAVGMYHDGYLKINQKRNEGCVKPRDDRQTRQTPRDSDWPIHPKCSLLSWHRSKYKIDVDFRLSTSLNFKPGLNHDPTN